MSPAIRPSLVVLSSACFAAVLSAQTPNPPANKDETVLLQPFAVTAERSNGYEASSASTATRTNTRIIDIPQTVDIVTSAFWRDIGATTFDQSFRYVANVFVRNRFAGNGDNVSLRGFETAGSISVDGVRMGNNKRDLVGYERLEVVKGPPSAVQGRAGGTGLLNYLLKKPDLGTTNSSVKYAISFDEADSQMHRVEFDANYAATRDSKFATRVAGSFQKGEDYIKFHKVNSYALYPSFRWQVAPKTELVLTSELLNLNTPSREEGHGFAVYPEKARRLVAIFDKDTDPITALGLPYNFNIAGPGSEDQNRISNATLFFTHQFRPWLDFRQVANVRYFGYDQRYFTGEDNTKIIVNSASQGANGWRRGQTYQGDLIARYSVPDLLTGTTMVGYSYDDGAQADAFFNGVPNAPFNTLNMAAIKAAGNSSSFYDGRVANRPLATTTENDNYARGVYVQQDLGFLKNRLLVTGGVRNDRSYTVTRSRITGLRTGGASVSLNSYRYGATFKITPRLALYAVQSVQNDAPSTIARYNGLIAGDPRLTEFLTVTPKAELKEVGLKGEAFGGRLSFTATYWEMTKTGTTVNTLSNGVSQGQNVTFGTVTVIDGAQSKGVELTAYGSITEKFSLIANYTDLNTNQGFTGQQNSLGWTTASNPGRIPLRFAPDWNANLFGKYSFRGKDDQGLEIKAGVAAIGPLLTQITGFGLSKIPDSQRSFDAGAAYAWKNYNFDFMITNLTNAPFLITRDQPPRTYRFSVSARF
jgi:iron complex outermembrane receptor protein